jgi:hypothetical protein
MSGDHNMNCSANTGGPAFPTHGKLAEGMSLRQYACIKLKMASSENDLLDELIFESMRRDAVIKLKLPNAEDEFLDELIFEALRDEFAAKAMQGMLAADYNCAPEYAQDLAATAYAIADAMLKAREK